MNVVLTRENGLNYLDEKGSDPGAGVKLREVVTELARGVVTTHVPRTDRQPLAQTPTSFSSGVSE